MSEFICETERLILREFDLNDGSFVFALLNSPGWLEFIGDRNIRTHDDAVNYIGKFLESYQQYGFGPYLIVIKETKLPIGMSSLIKRDGLEHVDIGFALLPEFGGKGYAFEAASATYHYAKERLGLQKLQAITNTNNIPSINLLKKLGFTFEKKIKFPDEAEELFLFNDLNQSS